MSDDLITLTLDFDSEDNRPFVYIVMDGEESWPYNVYLSFEHADDVCNKLNAGETVEPRYLVVESEFVIE